MYRKQPIRLTEGQLSSIVNDAVNKIVKEAKKKTKPILPYYMQRDDKRKDSMQGRFLRYSPEDSSFDSTQNGTISPEYSADEMVNYIDEAMTSLGNAREYARKNGHDKWFNLLNAILGELADVISRERGTGEVWYGKERGWNKPTFNDYNPLKGQPW